MAVEYCKSASVVSLAWIMLVSTVSSLYLMFVNIKRTVFWCSCLILSSRFVPSQSYFFPPFPPVSPLSFHFSTLLLLLLASPQVGRGLGRKSLLSRDEGSVTKYWQDGEVRLRGSGVYKYRFSSYNLYPSPNDTSCGNPGRESSKFCCGKWGRKGLQVPWSYKDEKYKCVLKGLIIS